MDLLLQKIPSVTLLFFILVISITAPGIYWKIFTDQKITQFRRAQLLSPDFLRKDGTVSLHFSGSSSININLLKSELSSVKKSIYVFDLQVEPHYFLGGVPISWYGYDYNIMPSEVLDEALVIYDLRRILRTGKFKHTKEDFQTEEEAVLEAGFNYINVHQTRRKIPQSEQVDRLIYAMEKLPSDCWVHFHCVGGRGRTTVAMIMYHILKTPNVPLQDIINYQHSIGGEDILDLTVWENGTYPKYVLESRKKFIMDFYAYVNDPKGLGHSSWTNWLKRQRLTPA